MKTDLKNGKGFVSSCILAYIVLSYIFTYWYKFEFLIFNIQTAGVVKFLIPYTLFMAVVFWVLKVSNSIILDVTICILEIIYLKDYSIGPIQTFLNSKITTSIQTNSIFSFGFLVQVVIIILNLGILFFAILRLHEQLEREKR